MIYRAMAHLDGIPNLQFWWEPAAQSVGGVSARWHWSREGEEFGPVSSDEIRALARSGRLRPHDLLWREGLTEWVSARKVKGLFSGAPPAGAPRIREALPPVLPTRSDVDTSVRQSPESFNFALGNGSPSITGRCPKCGNEKWRAHLGCLLTFFIVILLPIGLLLLLLPRRWECVKCHYSYHSRD